MNSPQTLLPKIPTFRGLSARFLLVLVPVFLVVSLSGLFYLSRIDQSGQADALAARVGIQAARVAGAMGRYGDSMDPGIVDVLLESLLSDRALLCAEVREPETGKVLASRPPVRIPVRADVSRLSQAYFNLVSNAVKFTPPGGSIRLHLDDSEPGRLALAVTDTGIGIAEENLSRILEPFEQVDDGLNRNYEGMGLGLSVARVLARRHGGDIVLQSELGKGTTASLVLPVNQTETEAEDFPLKRTG